MSTTLPPNVRVGIVDRTSMAGMTPEALAMLDAAAATAAAIGVTLTVTAAAGGGHLSHAGGTEFDIVGVNADGSPWTPDQRAAIARGAASGGADRFGLYSDADGIWRGNALHIGMSGGGRPSAVWGHGDLTGGAASRAFTEPSELVFLQDFYAGDLLAEDPAAGFAPAANAAAGGLLGGWRDRETPIRDAIAANRGRNRLHIFRQVLDAMRAEGVENPFRAALQFMRANRPPTIRDAIRQRFGGADAARYEPVAPAGPMPPSGMAAGNAAGPAAPAPAATPGWLRFGSGLSGAADQEVAALQTMLNAAGADIVVDGRFGPETERALARFQASAGIAVDGIAGPQTMKALTGTIAAAAQRAAAIGLAQKARMAAPPDPRDRWSRIGGAPRPAPPMKGPAAAVPAHAFPVMGLPPLKPPAVPIPAKGLHPYPLTAGGSVANPGRPAPPAKTAAPPMKPPLAWKAPPPTTLSKGKV